MSSARGVPCAFATEPVKTLDTRTPVSVPATGVQPRGTWRLVLLCPGPTQVPSLHWSNLRPPGVASLAPGAVSPSCDSRSLGASQGPWPGGRGCGHDFKGREEPRRAQPERRILEAEMLTG